MLAAIAATGILAQRPEPHGADEHQAPDRIGVGERREGGDMPAHRCAD